MADELLTTPVIDAAATATLAAPAVRPLREPAKPDKAGFVWGTGRRKTAVARVRIKPGTGKYLINEKEVDTFFTETKDRTDVVTPLKVTNLSQKMDVIVSVQGGGITGQAGAVVMGLARAICGYDPTLEGALRDNGLLTRDSRAVERKKYGQSGARRRFQFSKR